MTTTLLTGGTVYSPDPLGRVDVLLVGTNVAAIFPHGKVAAAAVEGILGDVTEIDCNGATLVPGLVDGHLHIIGGGGGQGTESRIPELPADAILEAGITTCVGMPGVDTVSRSPSALHARASALSRLGVRSFTMAGGFRWPAPTVSGDLFTDLYHLDGLLGVKIALGERLATAPDLAELTRLLTELQWLRGATGKAAVLHVHLGTRNSPVNLIRDALDASGADPSRVQITHANYSAATLDAAVELASIGCTIDVNPLLNPGRVAGAVAPVEAIRRLLSEGRGPEGITVSSDGNASVPRILPHGELERFSYQLSLLDLVSALVSEGVADLSTALGFVTRNPARALGIEPIGSIAVGAPADLVVLDDELAVRHVVASGRLVVRDGTATSPSQFRDPRWA